MPRPRFSIRDLLWLTLVVGMAVGWWADRTRLVEYGREQQQRAREQQQRADKEAAWSNTVFSQWDELLLTNTEQVREIADLKERVSRLQDDLGIRVDDEVLFHPPPE